MSEDEWWVTTGPLSDERTQKIAGPFGDRDTALEIRARIELLTDPISFCVVEDPA